MSYQNKPLPKKHYTGSDMIPLTCEKEVLEIREAIEKGTHHLGRNFEICYQAVKEICESQGRNTPNPRCASCTISWNVLLQNWLKKYDENNELPHTIEEVVDKANEGLTDAGVEELKKECKEKGIKFHHMAGIKKLTELLGR